MELVLVTNTARSAVVELTEAGKYYSEKEYDILKEMGCDEAQGYLFDKPMSWNRFEEKYL